jgi:acetoin utilization protein AcuB
MAIPTVESVMTPFPYSIEADAHAASARTLMTQLHIRHLPVRAGERFVAVISERDLARAAAAGWDLAVTGSTRVQDICSHSVYTVAPDTPLVEVLRHMAAQDIDVVLVMRNDKLAGVFTFSDACRLCAELLTRAAP